MHISLGNPCKPQRLENLCEATNFMGIKLQRNKLSHTHIRMEKEHQKNTENAIEVKSTRKISGKNQKTNERPLNSLGRKRNRSRGRRRNRRRRRSGNASGLRNEKSQMGTGNYWRSWPGNGAIGSRERCGKPIDLAMRTSFQLKVY